MERAHRALALTAPFEIGDPFREAMSVVSLTC
jgi:hypothetical protein